MIKTLLLIFNTVSTWETIVETRRKVVFIIAIYLLPLFLLSSACEVYGLVHWGKPRSEYGHPLTLSLAAALNFELIKMLLLLASIFIVAKIIQSIALSFQGRQTFMQGFTCIAYGMGPLLTVNVMNAFVWMPMWLTWVIGIALCAAILYQGLPRVLVPDPPHTLGLYFMAVLLIALTTGLTQFLAGIVLEQQIKAAAALIHVVPHH